MGSPKCSDGDFIRLFEEIGPKQLAARLGIAQRSVFSRRNVLQRKYKRNLTAPPQHMGTKARANYAEYPGRLDATVENGVVLVGSDMHYWPGPPSLMHRAFVKFCKELKPKIVVLNGDICDLGAISRHPPLNWTTLPTPQEEIEAAQERLGEIELAAHKARKIWPMGNHDQRWEVRLATVAPEFAKVAGTSLKDHFPLWEPCWSAWINDTIVIKHQYKGGENAARNNALKSGKSSCTGHLHAPIVAPVIDYNGVRWGVDCGMIANPYGPQFAYLQDSCRPWWQSFVVLTFKDGRLLWPELVTRHDDEHVLFRGEVSKP